MNTKLCPLCKIGVIRLRGGLKVSKLCSTCRKVKEIEKKEKHKQTKTYQDKRFKILHAKAWRLISLYVRKLGADEFGMNDCYTCGARQHYKTSHCSHYFHNKLDFDLRNLKNCCLQCNYWKSGHLAPYGVRLAKELGVEGMEQLRLDANTTTYTIEDLENIIKQYGKS
jgi:hypothetical protein